MTDLHDLFLKLSQAPPEVRRQVEELLNQAIPEPRGAVLVEPGLSVFKYKNSKFWWARLTFRHPSGKDVREATGETDLASAKRKAIEFKIKFFAQYEKGVALEGRAFAVKTIAQKVIDQINESKSKRTTGKDYIRILENNIIPYFGSRPIRSVDAFAIKEYFDSLKSRSKTHFVLHRSCFKKLFDYAVMHRFMQQRDVPKIPVVEHAEQEEFRDVFDMDDFQKVGTHFQAFIDASPNSITRSYRVLLPAYFYFLIFTGVRPGKEPLNLRFRDLLTRNLNGDTLDMAVIRKGKTSKGGGREVVLDQNAVCWILEANRCRGGTQKRIDEAKKAFPEVYLFRPLAVERKRKGKVVKVGEPPFERIWALYMDFLGDKLKQRYTLYSTRHTYINWALAKGVPHAVIAQNCGNSVSTIEKHYQKMGNQINANLLIDVPMNSFLRSM